MCMAALASGTSTLHNALFSDDTHYFGAALRALGIEVREDADAAIISVDGQGGAIPAQKADLFVGNAGTAARFLTALLALGEGCYTVYGVPRMRERPIDELLAALTAQGARITSDSEPPRMPFTICGAGLARGPPGDLRHAQQPADLRPADGGAAGPNQHDPAHHRRAGVEAVRGHDHAPHGAVRRERRRRQQPVHRRRPALPPGGHGDRAGRHQRLLLLRGRRGHRWAGNRGRPDAQLAAGRPGVPGSAAADALQGALARRHGHRAGGPPSSPAST